MGKQNSFWTTRVTSDDFANSASTSTNTTREEEEESLALAISALQSMPEDPWRNRVNNLSSSSSSSKRPRSATQAAMKTKCPTRISLSSSRVSSNLPSASSSSKKAKQGMFLFRQQQPQPTAVSSSSTNDSSRNEKPAKEEDPLSASTCAIILSSDIPLHPPKSPPPSPLEVMTAEPPESHPPSGPPQQQQSPCAPPYYECEEPQQQQQQQQQDYTEEDDGNNTTMSDPLASPPPPTDHPDNHDHDDPALRLARCRERNREHARKTRLRKKAALQELQARVAQLQHTKAHLEQRVQEQSIASILLGLTTTTTTTTTETGVVVPTTTKDGSICSSSTGPAGAEDPNVDCGSNRNNVCNETVAATPLWDPELSSSARALLEAAEGQIWQATTSTITDKRKRSPMVQHNPLQLRIAGKGIVTIQSQINWKTGTYMDDAGVMQQLNPEELEILRRERNRRHAKMTRDRKKNLLTSMEHAVEDLERDIATLRRHQNNNNNNNNNQITPLTSPEMEPEPAPHHQHGFSLNPNPTSQDAFNHT